MDIQVHIQVILNYTSQLYYLNEQYFDECCFVFFFNNYPPITQQLNIPILPMGFCA